jgi:hypothetical protein
MNYRHEAHLRLAQARKELDSGDDARLKYAALELRMAMEGITYDRALAYKNEFPPDEYATWQPRRVMSVLLEIDASADMDSALAIGPEDERGIAGTMRSLGTERVLNMATLKKHYDALSSYLHLPSMKQAMEGKSVDAAKLRRRCEELAAFVDDVLSSPVFNITLGEFANFNSQRCGNPIRKRVPRSQKEVIAECYSCHATYSVAPTDGGKLESRALQQEARCARDGCGERVFLWDAELGVGKHWKCAKCGGRNVLVLAIEHKAEPTA